MSVLNPLKSVQTSFLSIFIVSLGSSFYLYEYFLRVMPTIIAQELITEFHIGPSVLGQLLASFFYAYAAMQIPAGLICDQIGPKRSLVITITICAISTLLFQATDQLHFALGSRLAIGAASAFAFVSPLKLASTWFSAKRQALITGLVQLMGCLGAIFAGAPIAALIGHFGWRASLYGAGILGVVLAALCALFLQDHPHSDTDNKTIETMPFIQILQATWHRFIQVLTKPQSWTIGLTAFAVWAPIAIFAESWGASYLSLLQGISQTEAASEIMWVWIAMAVASPLAGWLSNALQNRKLPTLFLLFTGLFASSILVFYPPHSSVLISLLLFLLGIASAGQPITFGMVHDTNSDNTLGTAIALNNMLLIASCSFLQPLVGFVIESIEPSSSLPVHISTYQTAFMVVPISILFGIFCCFFFTKETYCKRAVEQDTSKHYPYTDTALEQAPQTA